MKQRRIIFGLLAMALLVTGCGKVADPTSAPVSAVSEETMPTADSTDQSIITSAQVGSAVTELTNQPAGTTANSTTGKTASSSPTTKGGTASTTTKNAATTTTATTTETVERLHWTDNRQLIIVTDQTNRRLVVLDAADTNWQDAGSIVWEWKPTQENGFLGFSSTYWYPSEAKLRYSEQYHTYVILTCASGGTCAMLEYPSGKKLWATNKEVGNNPHSMELLPNGNIAVASSGGTVRVYAASQKGENGQWFAEVQLESAHGVEWDAGTQRLLATYYHGVVAYTVGTADQPKLTEDKSLEAYRKWLCGHDLTPVLGKPGQYWITGGLQLYDTRTRTITDMDSRLSMVDGYIGCKSVDTLPDGTLIRAMPRSSDPVEAGLVQHQTRYVVFTIWSGEKNAYVSTTRLLPEGMAIYKARSFTPKT